MPDLLIAIHGPWDDPGSADTGPGEDVAVRRALSYERQVVVGWVEQTFGGGWAGEVAVAFGVQPATCFLAVQQDEPVGFCCFDTTYRGFIGPIGVAEVYRGRGVGRALLMAGLRTMKHMGYAYAVVGDVGPAEFYRRVAGAREIAVGAAGSYPTRLRAPGG